jgi:hypothetical protein
VTALAALALLAAPVCAVVLWRAWRLPPTPDYALALAEQYVERLWE